MTKILGLDLGTNSIGWAVAYIPVEKTICVGNGFYFRKVEPDHLKQRTSVKLRL